MDTANIVLATIKRGDLSESACEAIRFTFNPSGDARVNTIKTLTARLITELEALQDVGIVEAAVAITNVQTASMLAVLAATKGR